MPSVHERPNPTQLRIVIIDQLQGNRLDTSSMSAIRVDAKGYPLEQRIEADQSTLLITFDTAADCQHFNHVFLDLPSAVEDNVPPLSPATTATTRLSRESRRSTFLRRVTGRG